MSLYIGVEEGRDLVKENSYELCIGISGEF